MAITASQLVERVRLAANDRPQRDMLSDPIGVSDTVLYLANGNFVPALALLEVGLETIQVTTKATEAQCSVQRGFLGTTAVAHVTTEPVLVNPRFGNFQYLTAINKSLGAIAAAYGRPQWVASNLSNQLISVPANTTRVNSVMSQPTNKTRLHNVPFQYMPTAPTALASTGKAVRLTGRSPSAAGYIGYETNWTTLATLAQTLDTEFPEDGYDLIEWGAVAYLFGSEQFERTAFAAPHSRDRSNVSTAQEIQVLGRDALARFLQRRTELAARERILNVGWIKQ